MQYNHLFQQQKNENLQINFFRDGNSSHSLLILTTDEPDSGISCIASFVVFFDVFASRINLILKKGGNYIIF
jgi:hypothetical protein